MSRHHRLLKRITQFAMILMMGVSMNTNAGLFGFGGDSWKEEVLLHEGQKIIVKRSQTRGGRHEVGQQPSIKEHIITFDLPHSGKTLTFKSEYDEELGRANFNLLALHILNGIPYVVTEPNLCMSYNKWGRPNPPYVIFKHDGKAWHRIQISELPIEFTAMNLIINNGQEERIEKSASKLGYVSVAGVQAFNNTLTQPQFKTILREAVKYDECPQYPSSSKAPIPITPKASQK